MSYMELFPIYSYRIARELIKSGYIVREIGRNFNESSMIVFFFEKTEQFVAELESKYGITDNTRE